MLDVHDKMTLNQIVNTADLLNTSTHYTHTCIHTRLCSVGPHNGRTELSSSQKKASQQKKKQRKLH